MSLPRPSFAISEQAQLAIREVLSHHDLNQVRVIRPSRVCAQAR